jgi:hypothetical protein
MSNISDTCPRQLTDVSNIYQTLQIYVQYVAHLKTLTDMRAIVRATSDTKNKQKAKGKTSDIYVMDEYVHT